MSENGTIVLLSKIISMPEGKGINETYIDIINKEEIPVLCIRKSVNKERLMPFKVLYDNNEDFWHQGGGWEYYLREEDLTKLREKAAAKTGAVDFQIQKSAKACEKALDAEEDLEELEVEIGYGSEYQAFADMSTEEKIDRLDENKKLLNELLIQKTKDEETVIKALVETTKDAALINHAILEEAMHFANDEAKKITQDIVHSTHEMVKTSAQLVSENLFNNELLNTLVKKSNGTIVQHMTRVYLNGIGFLAYYNNLVSASSAIQKLRISFASKYRSFYHTLLPHLDPDHVVLEHVFLGGMRAIQHDDFFKWAVGFLIHDIGKASAIEYHEGEAAYDRNTVIEHVKMGFKSIMTKTNYPREASLITGYHHEYYGDPAGYGYFRAYLQQYKKQNPDVRQDYCITYELEPMLDYKAHAYFPAKVLEIVDVYDSVTDPNRLYRKPMSPEEALAMMREEFIEKHLKIDPIIFDIYADYIAEKQRRDG
ncbi:MAG: metal-dependent phosphohydrolase [Treponema sp.]|nr:metal-dependent phosphohydrolase [Treponema sp.]